MFQLCLAEEWRPLRGTAHDAPSNSQQRAMASRGRAKRVCCPSWTVGTLTCPTNGFSKKLENQAAAVALHLYAPQFRADSPDAARDAGHAGRVIGSRVEYRGHHRAPRERREGTCRMNQWTVVLLRLTIVVLVFRVVFVTIFSAFCAASLLVHGAVSQAGRAGQLVSGLFL